MRGRSYEQRLILFLDFLGFGEIVERTVSNRAELQRLISALKLIGRTDDDSQVKSRRFTQFSDSIVLSYRIDEPSGVFWLLNAMGFAVIELANRGYLLRGAITAGKLIHNKRMVVGPAMVHAYELESKTARFPRVIVEKEIFQLARRHHSQNHTPNEEVRYVRKLLTKDSDGWHYFDWISWDSIVANMGIENERYPAYLRNISEVIEVGLGSSEPRVLEKYLWAHKKYEECLTRFKRLPPKSGYRIQNPETWKAIDSLPTHNVLAKKVRKNLKVSKSIVRTKVF